MIAVLRDTKPACVGEQSLGPTEHPSPLAPYLESHTVQEVVYLVCFPLSHTLSGLLSPLGSQGKGIVCKGL